MTVCVRDGEHWVDGCLEALKAQTYRPLEIIAVDDGSSDGSTARLKAWADEEGNPKITILSQTAQGLSADLNQIGSR